MKKKVRFNLRNKDITASSEGFRFQPKTIGSNKGWGSISLGPKIRKGETLASTSGGEESSSPHQRISSPVITRVRVEKVALGPWGWCP
jgi:hypothetical protein